MKPILMKLVASYDIALRLRFMMYEFFQKFITSSDIRVITLNHFGMAMYIHRSSSKSLFEV